jgi:hypothetical protein
METLTATVTGKACWIGMEWILKRETLTVAVIWEGVLDNDETDMEDQEYKPVVTLRQERGRAAGTGAKSVRQHRIAKEKGLGGKARNDVMPGLLPSSLGNSSDGRSGKKII